MKRTFDLTEIAMSVLAGAILMLGFVMLFIGAKTTVGYFLCAVLLIGLVLCDFEGGKEGGE